jgi:hypothetical protein
VQGRYIGGNMYDIDGFPSPLLDKTLANHASNGNNRHSRIEGTENREKVELK